MRWRWIMRCFCFCLFVLLLLLLTKAHFIFTNEMKQTDAHAIIFWCHFCTKPEPTNAYNNHKNQTVVDGWMQKILSAFFIICRKSFYLCFVLSYSFLTNFCSLIFHFVQRVGHVQLVTAVDLTDASLVYVNLDVDGAIRHNLAYLELNLRLILEVAQIGFTFGVFHLEHVHVRSMWVWSIYENHVKAKINELDF